MTNEISIIDPLRNALAKATSLDELKQVRDMGEAARAWAKARNLGIDAENEAAEYILRSERRIGESLIALTKEGRYGKTAAARRRHSRDRGEVELPGPKTYTIAEMGLSETESMNFQRVAFLEDEAFEALLRAAHASKARISKVSFYQTPRQRPAAERQIPGSEWRHFSQFRDGVRALLGWTMSEDDSVSYTKNDLMLLPNDELAQVRTLVQEMVNAYGAAVKARKNG